MRIKSLAYALLISLVVVGSFNTCPSGVAASGEFPMTHLNVSLAAPLASRTVTNLNDSGPDSLRQAILDSNANPGVDMITFSVTGTITLTTGELLITDDLIIIGPGSSLLTVSGNHASRVFHILGVNVTIGTLTISNGNAVDSVGGGILNNEGTVTVANSTLTSNSANGGGGLSSSGNTAIINCTVAANFGTLGGGVMNFGGTTTITNSTLTGNSGNIRGGGVYNFEGTMNISNSTLVNNFAATGSAIVNTRTLNIKNSIVNSATGANCNAQVTWTASGINFSTDGSCPGFTQVTPAQLNLGPLANNGGSTQTHALLAGSVAIDAVTDCTDLSAPPQPVTTDQRGVSRPLDGDGDGIPRCDAGAYEAPAAVLFDLCIQDDSNGNILKINSATGAYQFTNCSGFALGGTGTLVVRGGVLTLQDNRSDRRVLARIDSVAHKATASIQVSGQQAFTITDRNTSNNLCACATR